MEEEFDTDGRFRRVYREQNVWDATQDRLKFIFDKFERVYVSFSGGKDSGVLLNLVIDYVRNNCPDRKVGIMVMDNETNYSHSLKFMHSILDQNLDILDVYWLCIPLTLPCTVSAYDTSWHTWGTADKERWVMPMPEKPYVVNINNHPFPFYREGMLDKEFYDEFGEWYSQGKSCASLIGIRTAESLNRFRAIMNSQKKMLEGKIWTKGNTEHTYNCYPIYDWRTEDIWTANAKNEWEYNTLYDVFYKAGIPVGKMRVASAFMSESKSNLNMYRIIDPQIWSRLCMRVAGANFNATYGKQLNYRSFNLPKGHTWKSFVKFLLDTLPEETSENFRKRFVQSILYWGRTGRGIKGSVVSELKKNGVKFRLNGKTRHGNQDLDRVAMRICPDHLDFLKANASDILNWKRFAITILKNDHTCKYLGLAPTKEQAERQKYIQKKYSKSIKQLEKAE
jgi:predicted phosphoadenosine phosphosulfate sulfurtransferase